MKNAVTMVCTLLAAGVSVAQVVNFDKDKTGVPPADWTCGVTGSGKPRWAVEADSGAPSAPNVLMQSGAGDFPWCVRTRTAIQDGFVEVKAVIAFEDAHIAGPGAVGVWTQADSVTAFDDFSFGAAAKP